MLLQAPPLISKSNRGWSFSWQNEEIVIFFLVIFVSKKGLKIIRRKGGESVSVPKKCFPKNDEQIEKKIALVYFFCAEICEKFAEPNELLTK